MTSSAAAESSTTTSSAAAKVTSEVLFAGCAAHSMAGRTGTPSRFDGVEERNVVTFSRIMPRVDVAAIFSGPSACHSVCVTRDGKAFIWGRNEEAQLGLGDETNRYRPTQVTSISARVKGAACGAGHTLLYTEDGALYGSGRNSCGQLGIGRVSSEVVSQFTLVKSLSKVVSAGAGKDFSLVCTQEGKAYAFGSPEFGQLGNGTEGKTLERAGKFTFDYRSTPGPVDGLRKFGEENAGIVAVACGTNHSVAMDADGRLYTWGFGGYGRLGHGDAKDRLSPEPVALFCAVPPPPNPNIPAFAQRIQPKIRATRVACGGSATYAIIGEPHCTLYFWGITKKAGEATTRPQVFDELGSWKVSSVACGSSSTVVSSLDERSVASWGPAPTYGELGYGESGPKSSTKPKEISSLEGARVLAAAAGYAHNLVLVDTSDEASKKMVEASPLFEPEEVAAGSSSSSSSSSSVNAAGGDDDGEATKKRGPAAAASKSKKKKA